MSDVQHCEYDERVAAFASGEPDDELSAHLPVCATCRAQLEAARQVLRAIAPLAREAQNRDEASEPKGELYWAEFARGVRAQLAPERSRSRVVAWVVAPALCAAATLVWMLAGRTLTTPTVGRVTVAPSPVVATAAPEDVADELLPFGDEAADPTTRVAELDDAQLDAVLARLDGDGDDGPAGDLFDTLDSIDDDQLDAVADTFTL